MSKKVIIKAMTPILVAIVSLAIFASCSNSLTPGSIDQSASATASAYPDPPSPVTADRSTVLPTDMQVRLVYARPETSPSAGAMIHFKVHTKKSSVHSFASPTVVYIQYWNTDAQQWYYLQLSKVYDGSNYTDYEGNLNLGFVCFLVTASWGTDTYYDTNGALSYYKVCNSDNIIFSLLQPLGYQSGVVGSNVGVSEAHVKYDSATMTYTLVVQVAAERLNPAQMIYVWYGRTASEAWPNGSWGATETTKIYAGSEQIAFKTFTFTGLTKTNTAHFYAGIPGPYNKGEDINFGNTYQVSLTDGNVMR